MKNRIRFCTHTVVPNYFCKKPSTKKRLRETLKNMLVLTCFQHPLNPKSLPIDPNLFRNLQDSSKLLCLRQIGCLSNLNPAVKMENLSGTHSNCLPTRDKRLFQSHNQTKSLGGILLWYRVAVGSNFEAWEQNLPNDLPQYLLLKLGTDFQLGNTGTNHLIFE